MREQSMVTEGDAETDRSNGCEKDRELKPIESKMPQVERNRSQGKDDGANQERAGLPVHTLKRNAQSHLKLSKVNGPGLRLSLSSYGLVDNGDR
jgi:hypothetical protein